MERLFARVSGKDVLFSSLDEHHLVDVLRVKVGQEIEVSDEGNLYGAQVLSLNPLKVEITKEIRRDSELKSHLCLAFALLKGGHDELVLQKGTELGVAEFYPFISERTIVRLPSKKEEDKRLERFRLITKGAAEQSKRLALPLVHPIVSFHDLLLEKAPHCLFAYEGSNEETKALPDELMKVKDGERVIAIVGPEGGFSPKEVILARENNWTFIGLGKRILRAETASIYLASVFGYEEEMKR
jgi:16S rRNA (uracil1498-N3)-methyltransferase